MIRASGGNLARTPGYTPTLYEKCHGIFNDHRESGPWFNVSSERRCSFDSIVSLSLHWGVQSEAGRLLMMRVDCCNQTSIKPVNVWKVKTKEQFADHRSEHLTS